MRIEFSAARSIILHATCGKQMGSALLYAIVSSTLTFSNKALPAVFNFNYPLFVLILQMMLMQVVLLVLSAARIITYPKVNIQGFILHLPVALLYSLNAALALASLQAVSIPTYGVLKRAGPLFVMMISSGAKYLHVKREAKMQVLEGSYLICFIVCVNDASCAVPPPIAIIIINFKVTLFISLTPPKSLMNLHGSQAELLALGSQKDIDTEAGLSFLSTADKEASRGEEKVEESGGGDENGPGTVAGVVIIVVGAFMTGHADLYLTVPALVMAGLSNVTQSMYVLLVEAKHKGKAGIGAIFDYGPGVDPTLGLLAYNSILSLPTLIVYTWILYFVRGPSVIGFLDMKLYHFNLLSTMLLVAFMGISLNYTMFLCIRNNSSLTTVMVGHLKTMAQTMLGFFVLAKDVHSSPLYVFGVLLSFLGGYLFTMAKYYQSSPLGPTGVWTWRWWQDKLFFNTAKDTQDKHTS